MIFFKKLREIKILTIGVALVAGLIAGSLSFGPVSSIANFSHSDQKSSTAPEYKVNDSGQTYGSNMYATSPEEEPDLIQARGIDGTRGYVKYEDLNGEEPKTPEEATAYMEAKQKNKKIPLYDIDGKTVIGEFQINDSEIDYIKANTEE
jgi:hypothetical protein